jgi:hypothetical protein
MAAQSEGRKSEDSTRDEARSNNVQQTVGKERLTRRGRTRSIAARQSRTPCSGGSLSARSARLRRRFRGFVRRARRVSQLHDDAVVIANRHLGSALLEDNFHRTALLSFHDTVLAKNREDAVRVAVVDAEAEMIDADTRRRGKQGKKLGARTDAQSCVCVGLMQIVCLTHQRVSNRPLVRLLCDSALGPDGRRGYRRLRRAVRTPRRILGQHRVHLCGARSRDRVAAAARVHSPYLYRRRAGIVIVGTVAPWIACQRARHRDQFVRSVPCSTSDAVGS